MWKVESQKNIFTPLYFLTLKKNYNAVSKETVHFPPLFKNNKCTSLDRSN